MKNEHSNTNISERNKELEEAKILALKIWTLVVKACEEFSISQATISTSDSNIILSYPSSNILNPITFSCNNKEEVFRIFSSIAEKSDIEGKIFCKKNSEIKLFFRN